MWENWLYIRRVSNSWGNGYIIRAEIKDGYYPERAYYGYSKKEALARYRAEFGLKNRKFQRLEY